MATSLDLDQLRTFVAIAETGSFTKAADAVFKTQSAVSMQMRRLEERIGKPVFVRQGRASRLTDDGERLLGYARRIIRLSDETIAAFDETELSGSVRLGTPDDYAERFLPEVLARFSRSNPKVEVSVVCEQSLDLIRLTQGGDLDLAIVTNCGEGAVEVVRREPLLWVSSNHHAPEDEEVLPLALFKPPCLWRAAAMDSLTESGRKFRVLYQSSNSTAVGAAVSAGLAVTALAESALRPGMRVLGEADGMPALPMCEIGLIRSWNRPSSAIIDALADHVVSSLDNISLPAAAA
ncbi:LysR substrate-binding domain-containing protein [Bauldia sp.]|uniref:LysR substrate-binding domain-containing protein n=1 Tax=Bauldia sp. TaxID=2575872 RepID=UPI003BAB1091